MSLLQTGTSLEGRVENPAGLEASGCVLLVLRRVGGESSELREAAEHPASRQFQPGTCIGGGDIPLGILGVQIFRINDA